MSPWAEQTKLACSMSLTVEVSVLVAWAKRAPWRRTPPHADTQTRVHTHTRLQVYICLCVVVLADGF